jgi:hypothetical protein
MGGTWNKVSDDMTRKIDQNTLPMMGKLWPPEAVAKNMSTSKFGNIFALAESPLKQGMIYAGTDDGLIWITENDGKHWTRYDKFIGVPEMTFVNYVLPSQHDESTVYACFDGRKNSSDFTPYLIKSMDKGKTWTSIASNLPSGTVYCIQEDHINPDLLFIGTEWGVWTSIDGGKKWVQLKKGIPTIQVKDLTIQRRDNDLVVATFGRGFYVLDDYSALRELSEEVTKTNAHIFKIEDALLYFPSSNLNNQGEVHFRTPNPDPAATFKYYVKKEHETLKQKRIKAFKATEKSGGPFRYPTKEELLAETKEPWAKLVFTVYDMDGKIIRKITDSLKSGYRSITWDLGYLTKDGPKVSPGDFKVALDKNIDGEFTRLVEPQSFKVISNPHALGSPNYTSNFSFQKDMNALNRKVTSARGKIEDMNTRLKNMKSGLVNTAVEAHFLLPKIAELQKEIDAISKIIIGGFGAKNTVASRIRFAMNATSSAQENITGAQREQYDIAKNNFESQETRLEGLLKVKLPAVEKEFVEAGGLLFISPSSGR